MTHRLLMGFWLSLGEEQEQQEEPHQNLKLLNIPKSIFGPKIFSYIDWSKAQIIDISAQRPKMKKNKSTLFFGTLKV